MVSVMPVKEIGNLSRSTGHHGFPVLDEEGELLGVVTLADLENAFRTGKIDTPVDDIIDREPMVAYPDQSLFEVLQASDEDYGHIPVVDPANRKKLIGVLRRHDIIRAYRDRSSYNHGGG